jgi:hypothetical protein
MIKEPLIVTALLNQLNYKIMDSPIKRTGVCQNLRHKSQLVKDYADPDRCYNDSYYYCEHFKKRITKRYCMNCKYYNKL